MASHSLALCLVPCIQDETRDDDKHADEDDEKDSAHSHDDADKALACRRRQPFPACVCAASDSALASPQHRRFINAQGTMAREIARRNALTFGVFARAAFHLSLRGKTYGMVLRRLRHETA